MKEDLLELTVEKLDINGSLKYHDDRTAIFHFENGIYIEDNKEINKIKEDVIDALKESHLVSKKEAKPKLLKGIFEAILRIIAPMF